MSKSNETLKNIEANMHDSFKKILSEGYRSGYSDGYEQALKDHARPRKITAVNRSEYVVRICNACGIQFTQGYIDDGIDQYYYCSQTCVNKAYTPTEKVTLQNDGQLFFTSWEE